MFSLSPGLLVLGLLLGAGGGVLATRTARWIFKKFPKTLSPTAPTAITPDEQQTVPQDSGITSAT